MENSKVRVKTIKNLYRHGKLKFGTEQKGFAELQANGNYKVLLREQRYVINNVPANYIQILPPITKK